MITSSILFGDNMIFQRQKPIKIWGNCTRETIIHGCLAGKKANALIKNGKWEMTFDPMEACDGITLEIWSDKEHLSFQNIGIGEVWIAGGQSNMQFYLRYDKERDRAVPNQKIRMFDYPKIAYKGQLEQFDYSEFGYWKVCDEQNLDYFSAVAYYFAMELEEHYQIPIGIIGCNWGGTPACAWLDPDVLKDTPGEAWVSDYQKEISKLDKEEYEQRIAKCPNYQGRPFENKMLEKIMYGMSDEEWELFFKEMSVAAEPESILPMGPKSEQRPGGLYENMVKQIAPYTVRGVIWYQGENDESKADLYHVVFSKVIQCWRNLWKEELPFLFVQLAPFGYWGSESIYPLLRREQEWVSNHISNTWMVSIMDIGNKRDIHPKEKRPVGERLALSARGHVYGESIECDAPVYKRMEVDLGEIRIYFEHTSGVLYKRKDRVQALEVIVDEQVVESPNIWLNADILVINHPVIKQNSRVLIRFAESNYCEVNLYNRIGLPMRPFTAVVNPEDGGNEVCCRQ